MTLYWMFVAFVAGGICCGFIVGAGLMRLVRATTMQCTEQAAQIQRVRETIDDPCAVWEPGLIHAWALRAALDGPSWKSKK